MFSFRLTYTIGGGYVIPLSKEYLDWLAHVKNEASSSGIELSACILEYGSYRVSTREVRGKEYTKLSDLTTTRSYPRQMSQGIFALRYLLDSGYLPSEVTLQQVIYL